MYMLVQFFPEKMGFLRNVKRCLIDNVTKVSHDVGFSTSFLMFLSHLKFQCPKYYLT